MSTSLKYITENIWFRILVVAVIAGLTTYFAVSANWAWAVVSALVLFASVWWVVALYRNQLKKVYFMLDALANNDSAFRFSEQAGHANSRTINRLINRVTHILYEAKVETVQQEKYYELILNSVNTGVIVLNDRGGVIQKNTELLRILGLEVFTHVSQLHKIDTGLAKKIKEARSGDKFQVMFNNERGHINLSVRVSDISIRNEHLRIFALNDINSELDEKELDSWIRLIRILTHEIMNAITPITSLSDTLLSVAEGKDPDIFRGLQTISSTGKGLLSFVESYRKFTRIPTPVPALFYIKPFITRMVELAKYQHQCERVTFNIHITPDDIILYADENLIAQVVINLLKNAIQAVHNQPDGIVDIRVYCDENEEIVIEISNNGPSIPPEVAEQIFVPFFTTKQDGSGIGLSLSRQIMRLSGGSITLNPIQQSSPFTTFVLRFK